MGPNADYASDNTLSLPINQRTGKENLNLIEDKIKEYDLINANLLLNTILVFMRWSYLCVIK